MNRTTISRERATAEIVAWSIAHPSTAAILREAEIPPPALQTEREAETWDGVLAADGGLREIIRVPIKPATIDPEDPLTAWALAYGLDVAAGEQCMDCGEACAKVERDGDFYIVCIEAFRLEPECSWSRPL